MNLEELVLKSQLDIKRKLEYINYYKEFKELYILLSNKFENIKQKYNDLEENKNRDLEIKKYYVSLLNFLENDIEIVIKFLTNYLEKDLKTVIEINDFLPDKTLIIYDDTKQNLDKELLNKQQEIINCIRKNEIQHTDDNLIKYIKNKYYQIITKYQTEFNQALINQKELIQEYLKETTKPHLILNPIINNVKQKCLINLSVVLDDFINYLNSLDKNTILIKEKEETIVKNIKLIRKNLNLDLKEKFLIRKNEYDTKIENLDLIDMQIGSFQNSYIEFLTNLENEIEIILLIIKNNQIIKEYEEELLRTIQELNKYLKTNLEEELKKLKITYNNEFNNPDFFTNLKESVKFQQTYLNILKEFETNKVNSYQGDYEDQIKVKNYLDYLNNTNPLLVKNNVLEEIKKYLIINQNQLLENALYNMYYQMLLFKIYYNDNKENEIYNNLDSKTKIYIEKFFIMDMEELHKNTTSYKDFYLEYLKNGLSDSVLRKYINTFSTKLETLYEETKVEIHKLESEFEKQKINYRLVNGKYFKNEETVIKANDKYLLVNKNGKVEILDIPERYNNIFDVEIRNGIIRFKEATMYLEPKFFYFFNDKIITSQFFKHKNSLISGSKFIVKRTPQLKKDKIIDNPFYIYDSNDNNYQKEIPIEKIVNFAKNRKRRFIHKSHKFLGYEDISLKSIDSFVDNIITFVINFEYKYNKYPSRLLTHIHRTNIYVAYDIETDKLTLVENIKKKEKKESDLIHNYSLISDLENYQFIENSQIYNYFFYQLEPPQKEEIVDEGKRIIKDYMSPINPRKRRYYNRYRWNQYE